uniref:Uncharacterized protein n=1 Tax=Anguilla anguilla TaxID=7936 RepID=A0A0E9TD38_ANGAN
MHQYRGCLFLCHTKFPKRKQVLASKDSIVERKQYRNRIRLSGISKAWRIQGVTKQ